ncbi:MAG: tyrosine-type recombinase/integrase [Eubacteriales bacterium]|nr:tyrosine-type recombinase/integrase [Eubacteriales bacterium]
MAKDKFTLGALVQAYFNERLIRQMNASDNTLSSYRDNLRLFLMYLSNNLKRDISRLTIENFNADTILGFLEYCETERKCSIRTRNHRLATLKSFFKYAVFIDPTLFLQNERIMQIPNKRYERKVLGFLTKAEVEAILNTPDRKTVKGKRHYALLQFMYNTGTRATEVTLLKVSDIKIAKGASQVLINGKGSKQRIVPVWDETADILLDLISEQGDIYNPNSSVFKNQNGNTVTRNGIRYIIDTYVKETTKSCPSLKERKITPHTFRHTTAMHLLQSGVDLNLIRMWLGHVKLDTTHQYIDSDTEMKRNALMKGGIVPPVDSPKWKPTPEILAFLDSIGK